MSQTVQVVSHTTGMGAVPYYHAGVTNAALLVSAGQVVVYGISPGYVGATHAFLLLYNAATAGAVTPGTTPPIAVFPCYPNGGYIPFGDIGLGGFNLGLVISASTAASGTGAPDTTLDTTIAYAAKAY